MSVYLFFHKILNLICFTVYVFTYFTCFAEIIQQNKSSNIRNTTYKVKIAAFTNIVQSSYRHRQSRDNRCC